MKQQLHELIVQALSKLQTQGDFPGDLIVPQLERARDRKHGDFACNVAMMLAKPLKKNPRDIAQAIKEAIPKNSMISSIDIAGPGFINIRLTEEAFRQPIKHCLDNPKEYGKADFGKGTKILLEFVSANPTGPLHVGHGRGAAYGACLADLLEMVGYEVLREYYVNDAGRQMDILAVSVWWRYLQFQQPELPFPCNGYKGDYILEIASELEKKYKDKFMQPEDSIMLELPADESEGGDKDKYIDAIILRAKALLGDQSYRIIHSHTLENILKGIQHDLESFGVPIQEWYRESKLMDDKAVHKAIDTLRKSGEVYEKEGALWFNASKYGDEKDRVLVRANGQTTYFASDVAYHKDKFDRGYHQLINVLGADHHGYVARIKAVISAMGGQPDNFSVQLVQFAILYRGKERVQMSTRSGSFVTLQELIDEVGKDAARFFYVMRKVEQHMDFDLELAKSQTNENPVYYIQYAYARICSILRQVEEKGFSIDTDLGLQSLGKLSIPQEIDLICDVGRFPEIIEMSARAYEPHQIAHYLREVANNFHSYYNAEQVLVEDDALRNARLCLIKAVQNIIANSLTLLGVSAPQKM